MGGRCSLVDVFTDLPLEVNQLGVFPDASRVRSEHMQRLTREMNLSQTVFIVGGRRTTPADLRRG